MFRKRVLILVAIATVASVAVAQVVSQGTHSPHSSDAITILSAEPERLGKAFTRLGDPAVAPGATTTARRAFVTFLHTELMPYLTAAVVVLYPLADSVGGLGGYAVAAALFDGEAILRQVKELDRLAGSSDAAAFRARTLVLGELLDVYFTKEHLLIAPVLARLSEAELHAVVTRVAAEHP